MSVLIKHFTFNYISPFAHGDTCFYHRDFQMAAISVLFSYARRFVLVEMTHRRKTPVFLWLDRWEVIFQKRRAAFVDFRTGFKVSRSREPPRIDRRAIIWLTAEVTSILLRIPSTERKEKYDCATLQCFLCHSGLWKFMVFIKSYPKWTTYPKQQITKTWFPPSRSL